MRTENIRDGPRPAQPGMGVRKMNNMTAAIAILLSALGAHAAELLGVDDSDGAMGVWKEHQTTDSFGEPILHYVAKMRITGLVVNSKPLAPKYVVAIDTSTEGAGDCPDTRYVYVKDVLWDSERISERDLLKAIEEKRDLLDNIKLAYATGAEVSLGIVSYEQWKSRDNPDRVPRCKVVRVGLHPKPESM